MTATGGELRIATWNVWWRFGSNWQARQPAILDTLRDIDADLVALQESWATDEGGQPGELGATLGMHSAFGEPSLPPVPAQAGREDRSGVRLGVGLLSRWSVLESRHVVLPQRHRDVDPVALVATVDHPLGSLHVVVTCLEWEPAYNDDRVAQAQAVTNLVTDPAFDGPMPVVLAGDLNAVTGSPVLRPLEDVLIDTWAAGGGDPGAVTIPSSHPEAPVEAGEQIDQRVDHVFVRPGRARQRITVTSASVIDGIANGVHASDHKAVVIDLAWTDS
ncbi:MAG TPA: endonuclease/exonuclease/phosphatase family protein [Acidothermales bacterium]